MHFVCCNKPPIVGQQLISVFASPIFAILVLWVFYDVAEEGEEN